MQPIEVTYLHPKVNAKTAMAYLGYGGQDVGADLEARLAKAQALCEAELVPRGIFRVFSLEGDGFPLRGDVGENIMRHLDGCTEVVLMAVTLGMESEMLLRREAAASPTDGLLLDACASSLAEQGARELSAMIANDAAARGMEVTSRFSPGYGDLPLACQGEFVARCGADTTLGIHVSEANMLIPAKSITAFVGLKPRMSQICHRDRPFGISLEDVHRSQISHRDRPFGISLEDVHRSQIALLEIRQRACPYGLSSLSGISARGRSTHGDPA